MIKKILIICLLTLTFSNLKAETLITCDNRLQDCFSKIQALPEAEELIKNVLKDGPIKLKVDNSDFFQQFGAFWDVENRVLVINTNTHPTQAEIIGSLLFELHNASVHSKLDALDQLAITGKISRQKYIESVERLEYENSLKTAALARKGIAKGLFPQGALLHTYPSFEEHFRIQQIGGHSAWIGRTYDQITSSRSLGTASLL